MLYTEKSDWLNNYLSKNGFIVSDHESLPKRFSLPETAKLSIRFYGNINFGYNLLIVINAERSDWRECANKDIMSLANELSLISSKNIDVLLFSNSSRNEFGIYSRKRWIHLNDDGLLNYFKNIENSIVENIGSVKKMNRSFNDYFQEWTSNNLSKFFTFNDIDALCYSDSSIFLLELKRPSTESHSTWLPYLDDSGNYKAGIWFERVYSKCKFTTIAYNSDDQNICTIFHIDLISKEVIQGMKCTIGKDEIIRGITNKSGSFFQSNRIRDHR
ncbi:hypothetical protein NMR59_002604 [Vibrio cholerae]|nr:hypothetical protein [Vibrio cholerae]